MLFNSFTFLAFFPIVFCCYWFVFHKKLRAQNGLIVCASYIFYGWWDWRFLGLIAFSSLLDYKLGYLISIETKPGMRRLLMGISILVNLGLLGFFKYFNFFIDSAVEFLQFLGFQANISSLQLILPVGISFYTFQTMSYTIDIYRRKLEPTDDPLAFFAFVSFFPQLVAGPIERASNLLPQFLQQRTFTYDRGVRGMEMILWGFFKKVVIADNCAMVVNQVFDRMHEASTIELILGMFLFSFQIYGDFSGYSDIAIGLGTLLGFQLMTNFKTPYFSTSIVDFWRRWHISLSTWFRDYVYFPLGGSKVSFGITIRNVMLVFLVSGLWHGANWTFVFWGAIHALMFIFVLWRNQGKSPSEEGSKYDFRQIMVAVFSGFLTFAVVTVAWVFFRSGSIDAAFQYLANILLHVGNQSRLRLAYQVPLFFVGLMLLLEWKGRKRVSVLDFPSLSVKYSLYLVFFLSILFYGAFVDSHQFIYFQF